MAKKAVVDAVAQGLAGWTACAIRPVNEQAEVADDAGPFLMVQYPVANASRTTHSPTYLEEGAARVLIHTERGSGIAQAIEWGEQIAALFRFKKINGVEFKSPTSPLVHDDNDDGLYFKTSVVLPYHYHFNDPAV